MSTLIPAYGRDYKTAKAVREDWKAGKDFLIADYFDPYDGKPANRESFPAGSKHTIRFKTKSKICQVTA